MVANESLLTLLVCCLEGNPESKILLQQSVKVYYNTTFGTSGTR